MNSRKLDLPRSDDAFQNLGGVFRFAGAAQVFVVYGGDVDVDVNAVEEGARNLGDVALNHRRRTVALMGAIVVKSAGLRVTSLLSVR